MNIYVCCENKREFEHFVRCDTTNCEKINFVYVSDYRSLLGSHNPQVIRLHGYRYNKNAHEIEEAIIHRSPKTNYGKENNL